MYEKVGKRVPNFNANPFYNVNVTSFHGYDSIVEALKKAIGARKQKTVVVVDYYWGVNEKKLFDNVISKLGADLLIETDKIKYPEEIIEPKFHNFITDDRINGVFCTCHDVDFFDPALIDQARKQIEECQGTVVVYGVAATVVTRGDILVYGDIGLEEVTNRESAGLDNWGAKNFDEEPLRKAKRDIFLERRVLQWHKSHLMNDIDFWIDCNVDDDLKMLTGEDFRSVIDDFTKRPFQMVPIARPGVWGGHWCQKVLGVGQDLKNVAWLINNGVDVQDLQIVDTNGAHILISTKNLEYVKPLSFLGSQVFFNYGYRCPCGMDYLDTWDGQNLSLQVHPTKVYGQEVFNFDFPHHESYYMMDTDERSSVYLGTKTGVKLPELVKAFEDAQETGQFDDEKYINNFPMKKHNHIFIPSGTIHASGRNTCVLELNPVGFTTFKLWDWGRVDFDGKPRPINIGHGKHVIQERYQTEFVKDRLISKGQLVDRGNGWRKEHSGLMEYEPMIVDRYWIKSSVTIQTSDHIKLINLVEGEEAIIESPNHSFEPFVIHYAEGTVIPADVGQFTVRPYGRSEGEEIAIVEVYNHLGGTIV